MSDHRPFRDAFPMGRSTARTMLDAAIERATIVLADRRRPDGHWIFELEADATIPAEYVLLRHYLGDIDTAEERDIARYLRSLQADHGGWPLFTGGDPDVSASVKAYYALKAAGDSPDAPHMRRAARAILARGGAANVNVFTRILLALFGQVPWSAVPAMPVEIMTLPSWSPFHLSRISYWSRTVLVPLLVILALKPRARNPDAITIEELFAIPADRVRSWHSNAASSGYAILFRGVDTILRRSDPLFPKAGRRRAIDAALAFVTERLNGEDGLGAIFPAMVNAVVMLDALGYPPDHPSMTVARAALARLVVRGPRGTYVQPCLSPVWDTALACHALAEAGAPSGAPAAIIRRASRWLAERQVLDRDGDWSLRRPEVRPGGWPFQYANPHYPDLDDTAAVVMALHRIDARRHRHAIRRGTEWVLGLQGRDGGWGAFDADNTAFYLNAIPFADHGALLDPPTADVTARCVGMLAQLGYGRDHPAVAAGVDFLLRAQESDGSWFGRWGTNYLYGTWSVLAALNAVGLDADGAAVRRAADWLMSRQRADGGWGEDGRSYWPGAPRGEGPVSTPSQTSWALLGLMAAGRVHHPAVSRGIDHLVATQRDHGLWDEEAHTAVGFPRVFYLRYHGYRAYFPLWCLARYRALSDAGTTRIPWGL